MHYQDRVRVEVAMSGLSCEFYGDEDDIADLLLNLPSVGDLKFVQMRSRLNECNDVFVGDPTGLLPEAIVSPSKPMRRQSFLVVKRDQKVYYREIVLTDGTGRISIADQNTNSDSVVLAFGGDAGDQTLIMSDISTTADTERAKELHKTFKQLVSSRTKRVGPNGRPSRLMKGAIVKAKAGWRLARDKQSQRSSDAIITTEELAKL